MSANRQYFALYSADCVLGLYSSRSPLPPYWTSNQVSPNAMKGVTCSNPSYKAFFTMQSDGFFCASVIGSG